MGHIKEAFAWQAKSLGLIREMTLEPLKSFVSQGILCLKSIKTTLCLVMYLQYRFLSEQTISRLSRVHKII